MKKVVDGKTYNTKTALFVAEDYSGYEGDLYHCYEALYRSKKGAFFIHGRGGASSRYARRLPDGWYGPGEEIRPISREDALRWCERHDVNADTIAKIFGELVTEA